MDAPAAAPQQGGVDWSTLPRAILISIMHSLSIEDCLVVRIVCSAWRDVADKFPCRVSHHLPIRLMVRRPDREGRAAVFGFFRISGQRLLDVEAPAAAIAGFRCCGHHDGWLAFVSDVGHEILLLNPVTDGRVRLPTCIKIPSHRSPGPGFGNSLLVDVKKIVLSAAPPDKGCIVAAAGRSSHVALFRPEHGGNWITLDAGRGAAIEDLMFACSGKLFALSTDGGLRIFDLRSYPRSAAVFTMVHPGKHLDDNLDSVSGRCLVELSGEVVVVSREYAGYHAPAVFNVFKPPSGPSGSWIPVTDFGDCSLFVSSCSCESITVAGSKETYLRKNCIYFTRNVNSCTSHGDVGVFSMGSRTAATSICISGEEELLRNHEAVWVRPSLRNLQGQ